MTSLTSAAADRADGTSPPAWLSILLHGADDGNQDGAQGEGDNDGADTGTVRLSQKQLALARMLVEEAGQAHLFASGAWTETGTEADEKEKAANIQRFFSQVDKLHASYPGGIPEYVVKARKLLLSR